MSIHFQIHINGETTDEAIAEFRKVFGDLLGAAPAVTGVVAAGVLDKLVEDKDVEIIPPVFQTNTPRASDTPGARQRRKGGKGKASEAVETGEAVKTDPLADASSAEKTESASTSSTTETSSPSASDVSSVSIDDLRAKLMSLSKTDGGHDEVFKILGKFGAKNASTVPEDKRGEVVALVDEALAGAK